MRRIRVLINTAIEHCSGIFPNTRPNKGSTTWVFLNEIRYIMNNASDNNKGFAILRFSKEIVPGRDRELLHGNTPVKLGSLLVDFLLQLLDATFFDFVGAELFEVGSKADLLPYPD
jgi:hypothetical protein